MLLSTNFHLYNKSFPCFSLSFVSHQIGSRESLKVWSRFGDCDGKERLIHEGVPLDTVQAKKQMRCYLIAGRFPWMKLLQAQTKEGKGNAAEKNHTGENGNGTNRAYSIGEEKNRLAQCTHSHCLLCLRFKVD